MADRVLGRLEDAVYWGIALVLMHRIGRAADRTVQHHAEAAGTARETVMLEILDGCCSSSFSSSCSMRCAPA